MDISYFFGPLSFDKRTSGRPMSPSLIPFAIVTIFIEALVEQGQHATFHTESS
jgi:hypothetical protein